MMMRQIGASSMFNGNLTIKIMHNLHGLCRYCVFINFFFYVSGKNVIFAFSINLNLKRMT